jgi:hypothetical protein
VKLASKSGKLPHNLFIAGVDIGQDRDPFAIGGFSDVFRGLYLGQLVAVKRPRVPSEDKATFDPVRARLLGFHTLAEPIVALYSGSSTLAST